MNWRLNNFDIMFFYDKIKYKEPGINFKLKQAGRKLNTGGKVNDKTYFMGY